MREGVCARAGVLCLVHASCDRCPRAQVLYAMLPLLDGGALFVITLKNFAGGRVAFAGEVERALAALGVVAEDLRSASLLANSRHEVTVVGRLRGDAAARGAAGEEIIAAEGRVANPRRRGDEEARGAAGEESRAPERVEGSE